MSAGKGSAPRNEMPQKPKLTRESAGTIWEHADRIQQELKASKAEVERLRETLEFIALDDSEHDSTAYYRAIANQTLRLLTK